MITVALVDDQTLIRSALAELVSNEPGLQVVGSAANGRDGVALVRATHPDVVLMDIRMPGMDGIQATTAIRSDPTLDRTRIVIVTTFEDDANVLQALQAGASGFIGKGTEAIELMNAIRVVHEGESLLSPKATTALISRYLSPVASPPASTPAELDLLTDREREILMLVGQGLANVQIAAHLVISPQTVKTHVNRIMSKLAAHDRAGLVIIAYECGLVVPRRA